MQFGATILIEGGLAIIILIAAIFFIIQAIFTCLLWRKGEEKFFYLFLSYMIAVIALFFGLFSYLSVVLRFGDNFFRFSLIFFIVASAVAGGLQIFVFIRDTWLKKEAKS